MPFDAYYGTATDFEGVPRFAKMGRLLFANFACPPYASLATTTRPNPSSQLGWAPSTHMFTGSRRERWVTRGYFCITGDVTKNYEMAPNYNLRADEGGAVVNLDIRVPIGTTTHYEDPAVLAGMIQKRLNDNATLAETYTVTYDDERESSSPTYKWTIAATGNFTLTGEANSILDTIGFTSGSYTGASTYTGDSRAIHTEEYVHLKWVDTPYLYSDAGAAAPAVDSYRWLVLVDFNYYSTAQYHNDTAGEDKVTVYVGTHAEVESSPDSTFTENGNGTQTNSFYKLMKNPSAGGFFKTSEGTDTGLFLKDKDVYYTPARYWVVDLAGFMTGTVGRRAGNTLQGLKIKIVNRQNPTGHIALGHFFAGPGYFNNWNFDWGWSLTTRDRSELMINPDGALGGKFRKPARTVDVSWSRSPIKERDQYLLDTAMLRPKRIDTDYQHPLVSAEHAGGGAHRPFIIIDPSYGDDVDGISTSTKFARGTIFGRALFGEQSQRGADLWNFSKLRVIEEAW